MVMYIQQSANLRRLRQPCGMTQGALAAELQQMEGI
jgi:DNA-binding XRE family transcriptional regulator